MKRFLTASVAATALLLATGLGAQAGSVPPDSLAWTYNFSPTAPAVFADGNPSAGVTFTNDKTKPASGTSDVVVTNLSIFSTAAPTTPDKLTTNGTYTIGLTLATNDGGTVYTAPLTFTGKLGGTLSGQSAGVTNTFGPHSTQSVNLGSYTFTVSLGAYTPPGPPSQASSTGGPTGLYGSISAHVSIASNDGPGPSADTPEPGTMLLSGFGLSLLGGAAWRKRRQARVANTPAA